MSFPAAITPAAIAAAVKPVAQAATATLRGGADLFARLLAGPASGASVDGEAGRMLPAVGTGGAARLADLKQAAETALGDFHRRLTERLAARGVRTGIRYELRTEADGRITVAGEHPAKRQIEAVLADDPQLGAMFRYADATFSLIRAAERHEEFAHRYQEDPIVAGMAIDGAAAREEFRLLINGDDYRVQWASPER